MNFQVMVKKTEFLQNKHEYKINFIETEKQNNAFMLSTLYARKKESTLGSNS
jgi:hypothetical protein